MKRRAERRERERDSYRNLLVLAVYKLGRRPRYVESADDGDSSLSTPGGGKLKDKSRNWTRNRPSNPFRRSRIRRLIPYSPRYTRAEAHRRIMREHKEHVPGSRGKGRGGTPNSPRKPFRGRLITRNRREERAKRDAAREEPGRGIPPPPPPPV